LKAAKMGHQGSKLAIGKMYYLGQGVEQNLDESLKWLKDLAKDENPEASYYIALMHLEGKPIEYNPMFALELLQQSAIAGHIKAISTLEKIYNSDAEFKKHFSDINLTSNAIKYYYRLGNNFEKKKKYKEAIIYYEKGGKLGDSICQLKVGLAYQNGLGIEVDYRKAASWLKMSADKGLPEAQAFLAHAYQKGQGVLQDYRESLRYFELAALQGDRASQFHLVGIYLNGWGTEIDSVNAYAWYNIAQTNGKKPLQEFEKYREDFKEKETFHKLLGVKRSLIEEGQSKSKEILKSNPKVLRGTKYSSPDLF